MTTLNWIYFLVHRLTCIYAACKIEENHVSAEELGKGISQDHQLILNNEMIVYQACRCRAWYCFLYYFCFSLSDAYTFTLKDFKIWTYSFIFSEFRIWSYCLCTVSLHWWFCQWYGGKLINPNPFFLLIFSFVILYIRKAHLSLYFFSLILFLVALWCWNSFSPSFLYSGLMLVPRNSAQ